MEAAVMKLHSREYDRASMMSSDLDLAFELQLDEALLASSRDLPSTSSGRTGMGSSMRRADGSGNADFGVESALAFSLQSRECSWQEQILFDRETAQEQNSHDRELAKALTEIDEETWKGKGNLFEELPVRPSGTANDTAGISGTVRDLPGTSGGARAHGPSLRKVDDAGISDFGDDAALAFLLQCELSLEEQVLVDQEAAQAVRLEFSDEMEQRSHDRELAQALTEIDEEIWKEADKFFEEPFMTPLETRNVPGTSSSRTESGWADGLSLSQEDDLGIADFGDDTSLAFLLQSSEFGRQEQELIDQAMAQAARLDLSDSLQQRDDRELAKAVMELDEEAWEESDDDFEIPLAFSTLSSEFSRQEQVLMEQATAEAARLELSDSLQLRDDLELAKAMMEMEEETWKEKEGNHDLFEMPFAKEHDNDRNSIASGASEECPICCESVPAVNMFVLQKCSHKICRCCLSQYVEVEVKANHVPVRCPFPNCAENLDLDQCRPYLTSEVVEAFDKRLLEASIPESQKVYCPFANCSALMSKDGIPAPPIGSSSLHVNSMSVGRTECMACHRLFCVECRVPWHTNMSCEDYQKLPPEKRDKQDAQLDRLAEYKKWQRCQKCQSMIELEKGCYHMTCRCGHEFCYTCGAEWKDKKATCTCNLWDENNILSDNDSDDDEM